MDLMDRRVDEKNEQHKGPLSRLFRRQTNGSLSSAADKTSFKNFRSCSDISPGKTSLEEMTSVSGVFSEKLMVEFVGDNGSLLSLQPWLFKREKHFRDEDCDASGQWSNEWSGFTWTDKGSPGRNSNWKCTKNRLEHRYNFRPVTSSENFFASHLCGEDFGVEEYTCCSPPSSPLKNERASFHMDGSRPMSMLGNYSLGWQGENYCYKEIGSNRSSVIGVPHLPPPSLRKMKGRRQEVSPGAVDTSFSQKLCKDSYPQGSFDGMFLFLLGVCIGIASSVLSNRMELEKLNKLLKDNKKLVEDLHEELEMKDLLIVKELANENYANSEDNHNRGISINTLENENSEWHGTLLKMNENEHACMTNPEALSEIEAELEAELEKLEQNINVFNVGQRISDLSELDSEIIGDVVQGELREDLLINGASEGHTACNRGTSSSSTTKACNANYSVSPKELSLRLHQVIESRLEKRIKELESALNESQMRLQLIETERLSSKPVSSGYSSGASSPNLDSPTSLRQKHATPLYLNLSVDQGQINYQLVEAKRFSSEPPAFSSNDAATPSSTHDFPTSLHQKDSEPLCWNLYEEQKAKRLSAKLPAFSSNDAATPSSDHDFPTSLQSKVSESLCLNLYGEPKAKMLSAKLPSNDAATPSSNHDFPTFLQQKDSEPLCSNLYGERNQMDLEPVEAKRLSAELPSFSSSNAASPSSNQDCPTFLQQKNSSSQWLDLSGDAVVTFDETYEEFMRLAETDDEKSPKDGRLSEKEHVWKQMWNTGTDESSGTGDDEESSDDAVKDLIQKIVEKTKQGSPAVINAQRMLILMDL